MSAKARLKELKTELHSVTTRIDEVTDELENEYGKQIDEIENQIEQLHDQIVSLEDECSEKITERTRTDEQRRLDLNAELAQVQERYNKEHLMDCLGGLSLEFEKAKWKKEKKYNYRTWTTDHYLAKKVKHNNEDLTVKLMMRGRDQWEFQCAVGGKSPGGTVKFSGSEKEVKEFAAKRVEKRLIDVKKRLLKELANE